MMNRRSFMGSILTLGAAPAIVRADSLMRIVPRETKIITEFDYFGQMMSKAVGGGKPLFVYGSPPR